MTLFETLLGDPADRHAVVAMSSVAALIILAAVAWRSRRAAACRPRARAGWPKVEDRAWTFCPNCGHPRPEAGDALQASDSPLPSDLLRQGWTRSPALDRDGRVVLPSDERAVAWSLWGAGNSALEAGSPRWSAWTSAVTEILAERHGGMGIQAFNQHPSRTTGEIVALAREAEIRAGLRAALNAAPV